MKILYISGGNHVDYLDDCAMIGLRELLGENLVDVNKRFHTYDTYARSLDNMWGQGMTVSKILPDIDVDRTDIINKIKSRYFDFVVYGSIWRWDKYLEEVLDAYPKNRIVVLDGEDISDISIHYWNRVRATPEIYGDVYLHPIHKSGIVYFKRELENLSLPNVFPISFAFPTSKVNLDTAKLNDFAKSDPRDKSTYIYDNEEDYYEDYRTSRFAHTMKKGGWDSLRHYEILGNGCIPYFHDIGDCPKYSLRGFPKDICQDIIADFQHLSPENVYDKYRDKLFSHFLKHNTTERLAEYILNVIKI